MEDKSSPPESVLTDLLIWDLPILQEIASNDPQAEKDLNRFLLESTTWEPPKEYRSSERRHRRRERAEQPPGQTLIARLESCKAGLKDSNLFEQICCDAMKYVFEGHFARWTPQSRVEKGFHRIDLLARLVPTNEFWRGLSNDFQTRYVIFEFKNHGRRATQAEVYTTEKYLYRTALRSVAIMIARKGFDDGARQAIKGALREQGKLIIALSLDNLHELLKAKDRGDDPHDLLFEQIDDLLIATGR